MDEANLTFAERDNERYSQLASDAPALMKLFGFSPSTSVPASADAEPVHGPIWSNSSPELSGAPLQQANPPPRCGIKRVENLPEASIEFPPYRETPRGSHPMSSG